MKRPILALCISTLLTTSACVPLVIGGAATAGYLTAQEKGFSTAVDDARIQTHVKDNLTSDNYKYLRNVDVSVLQGKVLLTGVVSSLKEKQEIDALTRAVEGVTGVYNEIFTDGVYSTKQYSKDSLTAVTLRGRLLADSEVAYRNLSTTVVNNHAYLMGLTRSQHEKEKALHIARTTKGVTKVHDFMRLSGSNAVEETSGGLTIPTMEEETY